jgi:hypothetical protein
MAVFLCPLSVSFVVYVLLLVAVKKRTFSILPAACVQDQEQTGPDQMAPKDFVDFVFEPGTCR